MSVGAEIDDRPMRVAKPRPKPWTTGEMAVLRARADAGVEVLALVLGRTPGGVRRFANRHGVSLRRAGERRGRRMKARAQARPQGEVCPSCGFGIVDEQNGDGTCRPCFLRRRAAQHDTEATELERRLAEALRGADAARQRKHRARVALSREERRGG